jgi:aminoglycoside 3-N-acetyltransferase I
VNQVRIERLTSADSSSAKKLFTVMAEVFGEGTAPLDDAYIVRLLDNDAFWAFAAFQSDNIVGGLIAHLLPMTSAERSELFIYDIAVRSGDQRKGIGRQLVGALRKEAEKKGIEVMFVAADNQDLHALDFYRALGGEPSPVTIFSFTERSKKRDR